MKKIFSFFAIAAMAMFAFSCGEKDNPNKPDDIDNIVEDGVYVMLGDKFEATYAMSAGTNEADNQSARDGMFEKYIVLDANQEFTLAWKAGDRTIKYGAQLAEFTPAELTGVYDSNPATPVLKGALVEGDNAPKMKAAKKALYHIVLDLNKDSKLDNAQILVAEAQYGVRGGMNSWGFTPLEVGELSNAGTTYTLTGQELGNNGDFKFAYNAAWKITLDAEGAVKANTNLGWAENKKDLAPGGANIVCADGAGKYKVTLTFKLAGGPVGDSFSYKLEQESKADYPAAIYMIGAAWGAWNWESDGVVELQHISAGGDPKDGCFAVTRYFKADDGFKFATAKDWGKAFANMGNDPTTVTYDNDGNIHVPADGLYTITLDFTTGTMTLTEGKLFGIGDAFGGWNAVEGTVNADGTASITTTAAGNIRTYAPCAFDWWQHEFQPTSDGKIAYREGAELEGFAVEAGVTVTYDFNAGTATVGAAFEPAITLDGDMSDWADYEAIENDGTIKAWKYAYDEKYIYFYYLLDSSDIKDKDGSYNWRRYIFIGFDTDNNAETGMTSGQPAGMTIAGIEAIASLYPFRGTVPEGQTYPEGVEFVNGADEQGDIECPAGTATGAKVSAFGYRDGAVAHLEVAIAREALGNPAAGTINVQHSFSWNLTAATPITIE
ncbi:MAG: SusF/SusE family outer membrane protein [Bacteroidales bacterium]|nr:SusF/SusE family outer membrane protein [Bacteroidales bacterium]